MSISTVRSLTTDFPCFPVHREIFSFNARKNRQARIPMHIRYRLGKGIQTSKPFVIPDISREIAEQSRDRLARPARSAAG